MKVLRHPLRMQHRHRRGLEMEVEGVAHRLGREIARKVEVGDLTRGVLLQVPYVLGLLGIAFATFRRKDILT